MALSAALLPLGSSSAAPDGGVGTSARAIASGPPARVVQGPRPVPLLLVSFDGFRWDHPRYAPTPTLDGLARRGVRAERLIPVFPSKTFPAHYSIVTGLHPGNHGIISNNMRDPRWPEIFGLGARAEIQNPRWWEGEPIWVTAGRQGLRTAIYYWPGSEAPIGGRYPDAWFPFDASVRFEERVDQSLAWLTAPEDERMDFVALYFGEPNDTGHDLGPLAPETLLQVERVDSLLGGLLRRLEEAGVAVNVVVVSDHGMARNDPARVIYLEDHVDLAPDELLEYGALVQIHPLPERDGAIFSALAGAHPHMRVWRREEIPRRLGIGDNPRMAPIVASPDSGWEILPRRGGAPVPGNHGQDPQHPDMQGIFYAAGPSLREGIVLPAMEQVDLYALMAALLEIESAPHDGDAARGAGLLR